MEVVEDNAVVGTLIKYVDNIFNFGPYRPLYYSNFQTLALSRIWTGIVWVEGKHIDNLTITNQI